VAENNGTFTLAGIFPISEDVTASIEGTDLSDFGNGIKDQKELINMLLLYSEVFSPTTETVPGVEHKTILKPDADTLYLKRTAFRKATKEMEGYWKGDI
jgi:hypothetical protein